jgi:spermidine synthase
MLAQVPLMLAPRPVDVLIVGWGSGVTVGSALVWPETRVTAVEIEPAVIEASEHFHHVNHDPRLNPRLTLYEDDARHILLASDDTYDVIVSEPSHPWVSGVANLFTRDFYALAARRLRPDGVFAQWLQAYQISVENFRTIMAAYQAVFPEVLVFQTPDGGDLILLGSQRPLRPALEELERRWQAGAIPAELARIGLERPEHLLATLYLDTEGVRRLTRGSPINTDDNMFVEHRGPADMTWGANANSPEIMAALEEGAAPIETALADPARLLGSRERLSALIEGLDYGSRPTARYEQLRDAAP